MMNLKTRTLKQKLAMLVIMCLLSMTDTWAQFSSSPDVEVKNNSFYIDGKKFFIKGIGYEIGALPGELPNERKFNPDQLHFDIRRILSGGFNTIRTWAAFTEQELEVLRQYDIKIIMGIWIDPAGDFSNTQFVDNAKTIVNDVLSYSKNYNNIIGYLIMNEPHPTAVLGAGYQHTVNLWTELVNIIHSQHPNRPVSIANTPNGTYIHPHIFDFSAYNVYIYNPVTVNYLHGYRNHIDYLQQLNSSDHPLIITEYGLSVSPTGPGGWGYGGNSLSEQESGDVYMYKSLVDGGANGACIFNYSDGWWKADDEFVHSDLPEEWFGLIEYSSLSDKQGHERPAWKAIRDFQSAIIAQPRSEEIYIDKVPVEIFFNDTIKKIKVLLEDKLIYQRDMTDDYLLDTLEIDYKDVKDVRLVFNCYDDKNNLIKTEEKSILITATELTLPTLQLSVNSNCWQTNQVNVTYKVTKSTDFTVSPTFDYVYYPHIGFDYGQKFSSIIGNQNQVEISGRHSISGNIDVFTVGAAFNIYYNGFQKRIFNQMTISRHDLSTGVEENTFVESSLAIRILGDPHSGSLTLVSYADLQLSHVEVVGINGQVIAAYRAESSRLELPVGTLAKGLYLVRAYDMEGRYTTCKMLLT
ncbi:hypothetical protein [Bacteroides intestinalis]|uniref:Glycoside hydrolase family 5 domain-containing protein n=1 Tax=Bacteroides intestinalis TaxID=329854 RepID=A0A139KZG5_9BACE|nr:hypothetical protein [Bacteroides intestinalis]KXT44594.1 hypothetical protein HMPREF2531_03793 [Bacteroides intestinalis]